MSDVGSGRVPSAPGHTVSDPSPSVSASGECPSRGALMRMVDALQGAHIDMGSPWHWDMEQATRLARVALSVKVTLEKWQPIGTVPEGVEVVVRGGRLLFSHEQRGSRITIIDDRNELYRGDGKLSPLSPTMWHPAPEPPASGIEIPKGPGSESPAEGESPALAEGTPTHPDTTTAGRSETGLEE